MGNIWIWGVNLLQQKLVLFPFFFYEVCKTAHRQSSAFRFPAPMKTKRYIPTTVVSTGGLVDLCYWILPPTQKYISQFISIGWELWNTKCSMWVRVLEALTASRTSCVTTFLVRVPVSQDQQECCARPPFRVSLCDRFSSENASFGASSDWKISSGTPRNIVWSFIAWWTLFSLPAQKTQLGLFIAAHSGNHQKTQSLKAPRPVLNL